MVTDEENVIRKESKSKPKPADPKTLETLEAQGFRPHGYEW